MDQQSPLCAVLIALILGLTGCASNGAIVDPIIYWDKEDPADLAKYGPTPVQRIEALDGIANSSRSLSPERRAEEAAKIAKALPEEQNEVIRVHMLRCLARLNTPEAFAAIKSSLFDNDPYVRREAVVALGTSKNPEAVAQLADVIIRDRDYDVRVAAATALGEFKTPNAKEALVPALDARDPAMRFAAIESLRKTSNVDYQGDTAKWREFAMGGNPEPPPFSIAEQLVPSFFR